jgi:hypothetical protein
MSALAFIEMKNNYINNIIFQLYNFCSELIKNIFSVIECLKIELFFCYIKYVSLLEEKTEKLFNDYPQIHSIVKNGQYYVEYLNSFIHGRFIEPFQQDWVCMSLLIRNKNTGEIEFVNSYLYNNHFLKYISPIDLLKDKLSYSNNLIQIFYYLCNSVKEMNEYSDNIIDSMISMNNMNYRVNYILFKNIYNTYYSKDIELPLIPSKVRFICIKYRHPNMKNELFLDMNTKYYYKNNTILSPVFVYSLLKHQYSNFIFDLNYELDIIDNEVNIITLKSNECIYLDENKYKIIV